MSATETAGDGPTLRRSIGPIQMALYGLGSMLGAGIYGLIGTAAGQVGNAVWLSFVVALAAALLTALSYASLGSRYPRAGGAAYVTQRAYRSAMIGFVIGLALVCSGLTSVATQSRVFAAVLADLLGMAELPVWLIAFGFIALMTGVVLRGIRESMWLNIVCTIIEAGGLLIVIAVGMPYWGSVDYFAPPANVDGDGAFAIMIVQGAVLTFFAFIGFEDTVNVAEECKNPERTIPLGLALATGAAAIIYIAVAITAVSVVPAAELAAEASPLTEVVLRAAPAIPPILFTAITLFAVGNTALVNYVTASRLIYGMSRQGLLHSALGKVHVTRRTPHVATLALFAVVTPLALFGSIQDLAAATVLLLLVVFTVVNGALFILKRRPGEPQGWFELPGWTPLAGAAICVALVVVRVAGGDWVAPAIAGGFIAASLAVYLIVRPRGVRFD